MGINEIGINKIKRNINKKKRKVTLGAGSVDAAYRNTIKAQEASYGRARRRANHRRMKKARGRF